MHSARTRDLLAGGVFVAFGAAFALGARSYDLGSTLRMGPGYIPLALACMLLLLGLVICTQGLLLPRGTESGSPAHDPADTADRVGEDDEDHQTPWVPGLLLVVAILVFGLTVRDLGLAPALLVTTFLSALAGRTRLVTAAVIAVGLTTLCLVIFVLLLQLRLPLIGPWLGG